MRKKRISIELESIGPPPEAGRYEITLDIEGLIYKTLGPNVLIVHTGDGGMVIVIPSETLRKKPKLKPIKVASCFGTAIPENKKPKIK